MDGSADPAPGNVYCKRVSGPICNRFQKTDEGFPAMVEKKIELRRRRARAKKMDKLKTKLALAKDGKDREAVLLKIRRQSPWWTEPVAAK